MNDARIIDSNKEKQFVYKVEYGRLNRAIKDGFYLEATVIGYNLIEDRCLAFLHHAGIVSRNNGNKLTINRRVLPYIRFLLGKDEKSKIAIQNISTKMEIIKALLELTENQAEEIDDNVERYVTATNRKRIATKGYMLDVSSQIDATVDVDTIIQLFETIDEWKNKRNILIHALLNQKIDYARITEKECAEEVYGISRVLDNELVKPFKKGNNIRRKYRIQ